MKGFRRQLQLPDAEELRNATSFDYLPEDVSRKMESLFMAVRNG